jgi:hypothetical protein
MNQWSIFHSEKILTQLNFFLKYMIKKIISLINTERVFFEIHKKIDKTF